MWCPDNILLWDISVFDDSKWRKEHISNDVFFYKGIWNTLHRYDWVMTEWLYLDFSLSSRLQTKNHQHAISGRRMTSPSWDWMIWISLDVLTHAWTRLSKRWELSMRSQVSFLPWQKRLPTASLQLTVLLSEASSCCFEAITSIHTLLYLFVCVLYFEAGIHSTSPFSASSVSV